MYQHLTPVLPELKIGKGFNKPIYQQIIIGLIGCIKCGQLVCGAKLPGTRQMASSLKIHRKTLQMALDELHAQGWIKILPRKGTFVSDSLPELKPTRIELTGLSSPSPDKTGFFVKEDPLPQFPAANFQYSNRLILAEGFPDIRISPMKYLLKEMRSIERRGSFKKYYHYGDPQGTLYFREILSSYLHQTRALPVTSKNIMVTRGAQMGLHLAASVLINTGDEVVVGDPGYVTATLTLQRAGGTINRVRVDQYGMNMDDLEALCKLRKIRLVYVISHHHHPTTVTLSPERRVRLLSLADRFKFAIVEDDYDYDFHYQSNPVVPIASLDRNGNTIYIGTLTKTLVPAIRVGFLIAPDNFIKEAVKVRKAIDFQGDSIVEVAIAELFRNNIIPGFIKKAVKLYRERRDNFCSLLKEKLNKHVTFEVPKGGLAVWCQFQNINLVEITKEAAKHDIMMHDGTIYNTEWSKNSTRLGFSSLDLGEQDKAIEILLSCIEKHG